MVTISTPSVTINISGLSDSQAAQILDALAKIQTTTGEIKVTDQEVSTLLDDMNTTTNAIAANVTAIGTTAATVKTELEALIAQGQQAGLTTATSAKLQALAAALTPVEQNAAIQATLLNQIAAEGAPVVPPPPPPPAG